MIVKVIIVGGDTASREKVTRRLPAASFEIKSVDRGEKGLRLLDDIDPAIVVIHSPVGDMADIDFIEKVKAKKRGIDTVVISPAAELEKILPAAKGKISAVLETPANPLAFELVMQNLREKNDMRCRLQETGNQADISVEKEPAQVQGERVLAAKQMLDRISEFIADIAEQVEGGVKYLDQMPYFISLHSRDLKVLEINAAYRKLLGDKVGEDSWSVYRGKTADPEECPVGRAVATGAKQETLAEIKYKSGIQIPVIVHTAPIFSADGDIELIMEISTGIREIRNLKAQLKSSQQRYEQLFNAVPSYITVLDRGFRLMAVNRRFKEDFGDETGNSFFDVFSVETLQENGNPIAQTLTDGQPHQSELQLTTQKGKIYNALVWTAPVLTSAGKLTKIMVIFANISQMRELQDHLATLGLMMASVSHSIKGILTGLDAGLYLVDSGVSKKKPDQVEEGLDVARLMADRMRNLIFDILYYAKDRKLNPERIDVLRFAQDVAASVAPKIKENRIEFSTDFDQSLGDFEIDIDVVRSALINILENAVDACLAVPSDMTSEIVFSAGQDQDNIIFDVYDSGIGMDQEEMESMFSMFSSSKGNKGTGLGLFISDKIIRRHGGIIEVDSVPGQGARFRVRIPKKR
jgi:PAS domain S-box-containing protein